jgi:hypothetical protein
LATGKFIVRGCELGGISEAMREEGGAGSGLGSSQIKIVTSKYSSSRKPLGARRMTRISLFSSNSID